MKKIVNWLIISICCSCVDPYKLEVRGTESVIVIDGSLTNELKIHEVTVSLTFPIDQKGAIPLSGATVTVSDDQGAVIGFEEQDPGRYMTASPTAAVPGRTYRLHVTTTDGLNIRSNEEELFNPGSIDSLYGEFLELPDPRTGELRSGVQFFVDTQHDDYLFSNYRYEYVETYETRIPFPSQFVWSPSQQRAFSRESQVGTCYISERSQRLIQGTTQGLATNRLTRFPIRFVDQTGPEMWYKYSIEVTQFIISSASYDFQKDLREINESGGSFFDRQKGTVFGNLSVENDPETVILGFFEVAGVSRTRMTFTPAMYLEAGLMIHRNDFCWNNADTDIFDTVAVNGLAEFYGSVRANNRNIFTILPFPDDLAIIAPTGCTDCREWGGTNEIPAFWD